MRDQETTTCPGCGVELPQRAGATHAYFNSSAECWAVFGKVSGRILQDVAVAGRAHQLLVDAYAAQHPGGEHPDKSIVIHLVGLHLMLERGVPPVEVPPLYHRIASREGPWPHLPPPQDLGSLTIVDVARAETPEALAEAILSWAQSVWTAWSDHHAGVARLPERWLS
ncbi:MAG TPA: DUF5946 family protein [Actinomycetota bacterium]